MDAHPRCLVTLPQWDTFPGRGVALLPGASSEAVCPTRVFTCGWPSSTEHDASARDLESWDLEALAARVAWCGPHTQRDGVRCAAAAAHPAGKRATAGLGPPRAGGLLARPGILDF